MIVQHNASPIVQVISISGILMNSQIAVANIAPVIPNPIQNTKDKNAIPTIKPIIFYLLSGMTIAATTYATIPVPPKQHATAHIILTSEGSQPKYSATPPHTPAITLSLLFVNVLIFPLFSILRNIGYLKPVRCFFIQADFFQEPDYHHSLSWFHMALLLHLCLSLLIVKVYTNTTVNKIVEMAI
jgi:hypothetical protein